MPAHPIDRRLIHMADSQLRRENKQLIDEVLLHRARDVVRATLAASGSVPRITQGVLGSDRREGTPVILASDWHVEEEVRAESTPTGNFYNLDVADTRIRRFFAGSHWLIDFHRPKFQCRDVVLWLGGDLLSGYIHDELVETAQLSPLETLRWLKFRLIAGIEFLLRDKALNRLIIPCSYGNHGRTTKKPRRATGAENSYEWLLYCELADYFASNKRVEFHITKSAHQYVGVYDYDVHFHHGDEISYGGGVGGIMIPINKAVAQWDKARAADFDNFGHFHQYLDVGKIAGNGSLIGFNGYAMSIKATPEPPQQSFYIVDSKRGKTCKCPIWVGE